MKLSGEPSTTPCEESRKGYIHSIESFGTVDGPGIRLVVFFQGCPMRCLYCHNPDSWKIKEGTRMGTEEILEMYHRNRAFYRNGGITATGGEPLAQLSFLTSLFQEAKKQGIHTCLDTSGITFQQEKEADYLPLAASTDLVLLDIKHGDEKAHQSLTGRSGQPVWDFLAFLDRHQIPVRIRHVLVPGLTDGRENLKLLGRRLRPYTNLQALEILPYHRMGEKKYEELGMDYALKGLREPSQEETERARQWVVEGYGE